MACHQAVATGQWVEALSRAGILYHAVILPGIWKACILFYLVFKEFQDDISPSLEGDLATGIDQ